MATPKRPTMYRRHFLRGFGGVTLGLPMLDAFMPRSASAQAAATRSPYLAVVCNGNGVVQAGAAIGGSTDPEMFWPTAAAGPMTVAGLTADQPTREVGELAAYATKILIVRGVNHPFVATGCMHASGDAQVLTGAKIVGQSNKAVSNGVSIDTVIANKMNPAGGTVDPLALHAGRYSPGGTGFDIPGYISYIAASQPRSPQPSPLQAYMQIIGNGASTNVSAAAQQLIVTRRKSVNDLVRGQIQSLQARTDLSTADQNRLSQHFAAIRDIELAATSNRLSATEIAAMTAVDAMPYATANHLAIIKLHMDLMVFALSVDYTRAITLKIGDREDDHPFTEDAGTTFHTISHRGIPNAVTKHDRIVRTHFNLYTYFLDGLAAVTTPTGTLLDMGMAVWTNQVATGAHSFTKVPWVVAGTGNGYLKTGQFVDLPGAGANTNQMLNTLLTAAGVPTTNFGDSSLTGGVITQLVH
jgi:hypothetical protein